MRFIRWKMNWSPKGIHGKMTHSLYSLYKIFWGLSTDFYWCFYDNPSVGASDGHLKDFVVRLGSLSICRSHPLFNFSFIFLQKVLCLLSRVWWAESILPSACEMFPLAATQPQSMTDPHPQKSNLSVLFRACYQSARGLSRCSFANVWCWTFVRSFKSCVTWQFSSC